MSMLHGASERPQTGRNQYKSKLCNDLSFIITSRFNFGKHGGL
jgi:hypothetical protein